MRKDLLAHYVKVAVRSLERYKTQSIISIVGLAVGFVCLSLSVLWVNYTNSYNTGYPFLDGERVYVLGSQGKNGDYSTTVPGSLLRDMKEWPEVEARCMVSPHSLIPIGEKGEEAMYILLNPLMKDFFHFDVVAGEKDFWRHIGEKDFMHCDIVLTEPFAQKMFGTEDPIGKTMEVTGNEHTIVRLNHPDAIGMERFVQFDDSYSRLTAFLYAIDLHLLRHIDIHTARESPETVFGCHRRHHLVCPEVAQPDHAAVAAGGSIFAGFTEHGMCFFNGFFKYGGSRFKVALGRFKGSLVVEGAGIVGYFVAGNIFKDAYSLINIFFRRVNISGTVKSHGKI